ncbi:helix-turn-helix domain-containing protein [Nocardioides sp. NPDC051685]|uniref:helix-turn-helix domain-containing protein n=1 Tax=Nocardioides sp. NPDC051685 TaxID=3364334 RepID=UPI00379A0802
MRDLIGKLEVVDDDAASALRVIDHFDRLVDEGSSTAAVVRAAAALAGSTAGLHDAARGVVKRFAADGRTLTGETEGDWHHEPVPGQPGSWLWLERTGEDGPLDALILERAARALQALGTGSPSPSAGGLVRIACDPDATDADRQDAVAQLGLTGPVTVVLSPSANLRATLISTVGALVVALLPGTPTIPEGIRAGAATAPDPRALPTALEQARTALRLAADVGGLAPAVVRYEDLGALAVIAERISADEAAGVGDVRRLDELLAGHPWVVETLHAVLDQPSLRQSAALLHVHHSTLQERLTWLSGQLGYSPVKGRGRQRAAVAVLLWRVTHGTDPEIVAESH